MRVIGIVFALVPFSVFAQEADGVQGNAFASLLPLIFIFAIFYFLLIRPQQKRFRAHQDMVAAVKKGDNVVTGGGFVGKITRVADDAHVMVEIAPGVEVKVVKTTLTSVGDSAIVVPTKEKHTKTEKNDNTVPAKDKIANDN
jgi:preprotein translocase subunit YajC